MNGISFARQTLHFSVLTKATRPFSTLINSDMRISGTITIKEEAEKTEEVFKKEKVILQTEAAKEVSTLIKEGRILMKEGKILRVGAPSHKLEDMVEMAQWIFKNKKNPKKDE